MAHHAKSTLREEFWIFVIHNRHEDERPVMEHESGWEDAVRARLLARDDAALGELYDQYGSYVFGLAARVINDRRAAEDVTQDVFLAIWERPECFDPERGRLRTFLGTIAHRRAIDYVRREEARRRRSERDAAAFLPIPDVDELAMALVTAEHVRAEVERLPSEQRVAIELAYFGCRTYRQVAAELGIPEGTAKSRMRLGLRRIADALEARGLEQAWT
ncbi:MAG: sigma-70 family RNA polymerase sigma factor [Actinomycetota bacterium]